MLNRNPPTRHSPETHEIPAESLSRSSQRMLAPIAYNELAMPSLRLARSSRIARNIALILFGLLIVTTFLLAFAPWQQSITGSGSVIAFAPRERQQVLESPIKGRVVRWGEGIFENARVVEGQLIAEIRDLDEAYSMRLAQQLVHTDETVRAAKEQIRTGKGVLDASRQLVSVFERQEQTYRQVKADITQAQNFYVSGAEEKVRSLREQLSIEQAAVPQLQNEYERLRGLQVNGNVALQKVQEVEAKLLAAKSKVRKAEADVAAAEHELDGKRKDRAAYIQKAQIDVEYAHGMYQKALSDTSKAEGDIAKAESELAKAEKELREMERKVAVQSNQLVAAPMDGFIVQITANFETAILKEGDPICTIVPETEDRAVQIWVNGNDVPLVSPGRHVRLQFEGWPAVQFAGWPSVAVGTFGGEVASIDATDHGKGKFRILVLPAPSAPPWPDERYLRQGVRSNGWVLLETVPLWWEVWRRLNSFPPIISPDGASTTDSKVKPPKTPK